MDDEKKLINWISNNADKLNLKLTYLVWPKRWGTELHDCDIEVTIDEKVFRGRGTSKNRDVSIIKAFSESIERYFLRKFSFPNSNGMAAHTSPDKATAKAKEELIERDIFMCHFLTKTPFLLEPEEVNLTEITPMLSKLRSFGLDVTFYTSLSAKETYSLCRIGGTNAKAIKPFGLILGSALKKNKSESVLTAFLEATRYAVYIVDNQQIEDLPFSEFEKIKQLTFDDHGRLALNLDYSKQLNYLFPSQIVEEHLNFNEVGSFTSFEIDCSKYPETFGLPLIVSRIENDNLQSLFLGRDVKNINFNRIITVRKKDAALDINNLPHPYR